MDFEKAADETYHSTKPGRMNFLAMDPSIALCFYCKTELDFDNLCKKLVDRFSNAPLPLFEICEKRPHDWNEPVFCPLPNSGGSAASGERKVAGFTSIGLPCSSKRGGSSSSAMSGVSDVDDEEFEILG